jgi:hypothetical protein
MIFSERFNLIQECVEEKHKIIDVPIFPYISPMTDTKFQSINLGDDDIIEGSHEEDVFDIARNHAHIKF